MGVSRAGEDKLAWISFRSVVYWDVRACDLDHCPPLLGEDCARGISVGGTNAPGKDHPPKDYMSAFCGLHTSATGKDDLPKNGHVRSWHGKRARHFFDIFPVHLCYWHAFLYFSIDFEVLAFILGP